MNWWQSLIGGKRQPTSKQQIEQLEESIRVKQLQQAKSIMENSTGMDYWLSSYVDLLDRYRDGNTLAYPVANATDRQFGSNYPFWVSEQQLAMIRAQARVIAYMNPNAAGFLNGLTSYVIGNGYNYTVKAKKTSGIPDEAIEQIQEFINEFIEDNSWTEMEQEIFLRSRRDGEAFIRMFPQEDGKMIIRTVEPEQIFQPGQSSYDWSYGIQTDPDDVFDIKAYHVHYLAPGGEHDATDRMGEVVDAKNIVHIKVNVERAIKRGLSDFSYDTLDAFQQAGKLRRNLGEGAAVQAAIAAIRQHDAASSSQVETFVQAAIDYSTSGMGGRQQDYQRMEAGSFLDIPKGMNYITPPGSANSGGHLEIMGALLRAAGNRHNAPEWMVSSDASNTNYASSLTAESPFLRNCLRLQKFYERPFLRVIKSALECAIKAGKLPKGIMSHIDVEVKAPSVETRDKVGEASMNSMYVQMGAKSPQIVTQELGLDWDAVAKDNLDFKREMGGTALVLDTNMPQPAGQSAAQPPEATPQKATPKKMPKAAPESIQEGKPGLWDNINKKRKRGESPAKPGDKDYPDPKSFAKAQESESDIDLTPPKGVQDAAKKALEVRASKPASQRGMTPVGIARARDLSNGTKLSPETVRRMLKYFTRHEKDKNGETWDDKGAGWQAWMGWGGDAGYSWARKIVKQLDRD